MKKVYLLSLMARAEHASQQVSRVAGTRMLIYVRLFAARYRRDFQPLKINTPRLKSSFLLIYIPPFEGRLKSPC